MNCYLLHHCLEDGDPQLTLAPAEACPLAVMFLSETGPSTLPSGLPYYITTSSRAGVLTSLETPYATSTHMLSTAQELGTQWPPIAIRHS